MVMLDQASSARRSLESPLPGRSAAENPELKRRLKKLTHDYIDGRVDIPFLDDIRTEFNREYPGAKLQVIDLMQGSLHHERANQDNHAYHIFLEQEAKKLGVPVTMLTREQVQGLYGDFAERDRMEQEEQRTLALYSKSAKGFWKGEKMEAIDPRILSLELQLRRAGRIPNEAKRDQRIEEIEYQIQEAASLIDDFGKRAEYQYLALLRRWQREAGIPHVSEAYHSIPRDDLTTRRRSDGTVVFGGKLYDLQMKAWEMNDPYTAEQKRKEIEATRRQLAGTGTYLIVVPPDYLRDAVRLSAESHLDRESQRRFDTHRQSLMQDLAHELPPEGKDFVQEHFLPKRANREKKKGSTLTAKFIEKNSSVAQLMKLGLLDEGDISDSAVILKAKKTLKANLPAVRKIFSSPEAYLNPTNEDREMVKQALG